MTIPMQNIHAISAYFASGCKDDKLLGLELEHFLVECVTGCSLPYEVGAKILLEKLAGIYGEPVYSGGVIIGLANEDAAISLEPAAQLEISIRPLQSLAQIRDVYNEFSQAVSPILNEMGWDLVCAGYHPKSRADDLSLIPKTRYEHMYRYFRDTGSMGKYMMKGTAATQVSIDYSSETDFLRKFRVACVLGPLFSLLCDNTTVFEGVEYNNHLARTFIWNNVDSVRCMIPDGALESGFGFDEYARYIYHLPSIFAVSSAFGEEYYTGAIPVSELFADRLMTREDIEHCCSLAFPDCRLKTRLELRMADSMPIDDVLGFTALLKGIFYQDTNLDLLYDRTIGIGAAQVARAKEDLIKHGYAASVYGRSAYDWIRELLKMANSGLDENEVRFLCNDRLRITQGESL